MIVAMVGGFGEKKTKPRLQSRDSSVQTTGFVHQTDPRLRPRHGYGIITAATVLIDEPKYLDPQNPDRRWPNNYNNRYRGPSLYGMRFDSH